MGDTNWRTEFDESYAVPEEILALVKAGEIEDLSWHNDASPSFGRVDADAGRALHLWVQHPDPSRREFGGPRFIVNEMDLPDHIATDDVHEAIRVLREQLAKFVR